MKILITILLSLLLLGCGATEQEQQQGYTVTIDPYQNFERYSALNAGYLDGQQFLSLQFLTLDMFTDVVGEKHTLWIAAILEGDHWQFISPGKSLVLLIDNEPVELNSINGSRNSRKVLSAKRIREEALYKIAPEVLKKIASANAVSLRLYGSEGYIERRLSSNHLINYRAYYERFVLPRLDKFTV
tara:strand:- start:2097 stop:2654 length:558 start_codon:yes stop_codon:yes gene_type:complete